MRNVLLIVLVLLLRTSLVADPAPNYIFSKTPTALTTSYFDYLIGSGNNIPLQVIPQTVGGGYFATYHGSSSPTSLRRAYFAYLDDQGNVLNNNFITSPPFREGYPAIAVDPVWGKPFYAWHADVDGDEALEVLVTSDAFISGCGGLFNTPQIVIDNPYSFTAPDGTIVELAQFFYPTLAIGPSPIAGKHRLYLAARNAIPFGDVHSRNNALIAFTDFNQDDIEMGLAFVWNYTMVPQLNAWYVDSTVQRIPNYGLVCDQLGNVFLAGYHTALDAEGNEVTEPKLDVFKCDNFGQGTWTYYSASDALPSWNPAESPTSSLGYFKNEDGVPYSNEQLNWRIMNSANINCSMDSYGRIHVPGLWGLKNSDGAYYEELQFLKEFRFNTSNAQFSINEIYPQKRIDDNVNECFQPWDTLHPLGVTDGWTETEGIWAPNMQTAWNLSIWGDDADLIPAYFYYNNLKLTQANSQGRMAAVWQSSWRARQYLVHDNQAYSAWSETPEIMISFSSDDGYSWSDPISLNNVEIPQFNGLTPMWVYPADQMIFYGFSDYGLMYKLGLLFYDDYNWFANSASHAQVANPGGRVMFCELLFNPSANDDPALVPAVVLLKSIYPNPFKNETKLQLELPKTTELELNIYNLKGQLVKQLYRGKADSGTLSLTWDGCDTKGKALSSGIYFCKVVSSTNNSETHKLMLLK